MRIVSSGLRGWKQSWKGDLKASITVAFIAIPLGLGIGLASGVPPLAAVIPSVIGGLLLAWISGGNIIVHSTPKMLIGVTAAAVLELGGEDVFLGYRLFLAAVVIAGLIQLVLGLFRMGILGDLIPASVIKSLLASVGVYIILKQIPSILGSPDHSTSIVDLMMQIPQLMTDMNPLISLIGFGSIIIMFGHSRFENPIIKTIPAVLWVIVSAIAYAYTIGFEQVGSLNLLGRQLEFGPHYLIQLPAELSGAIVHPDFGHWRSTSFWSVVLAIVVIGSIEAILSVKAIDRLDTKKRKSNVNRELGVVGIGTMVSGWVGGLPVIPGIVPSSVSANNDGKTPLVDFFQALIILVLVVVLGSQLQHIPLAALAGILIHTGFKLVNPREILNIIRIGWDQTLIFGVTLITTLGFNLIIGFAVGISCTLVIHIIRLRSLPKLFAILFKPNVVAYQEDEDGNQFLVSVKGYSNFLNYPRLKNALDLIPPVATINLDLSLTEFIDHTVMEHLADYEENHIRRGGRFEIIGLDNHLTSAGHSLSSRFKKSISSQFASDSSLTSRQLKLKDLATKNQLAFSPEMNRFVETFEPYRFFKHKTVDRAYNSLSGDSAGASILIQDIDYHSGELEYKEKHQTTVAIIQLNRNIPSFTLEKEYLVDKIAALVGYDDIDFPEFKRFSDEFSLNSDDRKSTRSFFNAELIELLEKKLIYRMESKQNCILIIGKDRLFAESEVEDLLTMAVQLTALIRK